MTMTEQHRPTKTRATAVPAIVTHGPTKVYPGDILAVDDLNLVVDRG